MRLAFRNYSTATRADTEKQLNKARSNLEKNAASARDKYENVKEELQSFITSEKLAGQVREIKNM